MSNSHLNKSEICLTWSKCISIRLCEQFIRATQLAADYRKWCLSV